MSKLILLLHGVSVSDAEYGEPLADQIREYLGKQGSSLPYIYKGFWGDFLGEHTKLWTSIEQELNQQKTKDTSFDDLERFKYKAERKGAFSRFIGDTFSYLNPQIGRQIRKKLSERLQEVLALHPEAKELYFVAHSLGTAILWDILFSKSLPADDPAWDIRLLLTNQIALQGVATMGSPIPFVNMTLGIQTDDVESRLQDYVEFQGEHLKWLNFVHPSDLIAYPLYPVLGSVKLNLLQLKDIYLMGESTDSGIEGLAQSKVSQFLGGMNPELRDMLDALAAIAGTSLGHSSYFQNIQVAQELADMLYPKSDETKAMVVKLQDIISQIQQVPGMTDVESRVGESFGNLPDSQDETICYLVGGTGMTIRLSKNLLRIHHISVVDSSSTVVYFGYVGWLHAEGLRTFIANLQHKYNLTNLVR